jgi:hypothetical protein
MTRTTPATKTPRTTKTDNRDQAEKVLRDIAFVLSMTRRVREEIVSDLPPRVLNRSVSVTAPWAEALV